MRSRYESVVLRAVPSGCERALDVGCGNGGLTRELRRAGVRDVVGIDRNEPCIERRRAYPDAGDISYVAGDLLTSSLEPASFDLVSAVASLHQMDARSGLVRLRDLVAPGGFLVVIGLAKPDLPKDIPLELAAVVVNLVRPESKDPDNHPQPPIIWPPPERYATMRRLAAELLPGVQWQRHLLWRYSLIWKNTS